MERCHSRGKNSQEGFACCSDSRSVQHAFPFLLWKNADFTCLGIHFLIHVFIPGFDPQGIHLIINKLSDCSLWARPSANIARTEMLSLLWAGTAKLQKLEASNSGWSMRSVTTGVPHNEQFHRGCTIFTAAMPFTGLKTWQTTKTRRLFLGEWNWTSLLISWVFFVVRFGKYPSHKTRGTLAGARFRVIASLAWHLTSKYVSASLGQIGSQQFGGVFFRNTMIRSTFWMAVWIDSGVEELQSSWIRRDWRDLWVNLTCIFFFFQMKKLRPPTFSKSRREWQSWDETPSSDS